MAQKFKSVEEAKELKVSTKDELKVAKKELKSFLAEHKLDAEADHSEHEKHGKKFKRLREPILKKEALLVEIEEFLAKGKEKKAASERATKYEYPAGATSAEKKDIRTKARAAAKKAAKAEKGGEEKKSKKDKKAEAAPVEEKKDTGKKKDKKKEKADKTED